MRPITRIVVHCSASPNGRYITAGTIDAWHAARGFHRDPAAVARCQPHLPHIGYHYVVLTDGTVVKGRGDDEIGAHAAGANKNSLGICMVGTDRYTPAQWNALRCLFESAPGAEHPAAQWLGHRDLSPDLDGDGVIERHEWLKTCPGFDVAAWMARGLQPLPENVLEVN